jgi:hypothetical protein
VFFSQKVCVCVSVFSHPCVFPKMFVFVFVSVSMFMCCLPSPMFL